MAEGNDDQNAAERDKCVARAQAQDDEHAADELDERDTDTDSPKRPDRQKSVGERKKIFSCVFDRAELKDLHHAGHEKNESENQACEKQRPGAIQIPHPALKKQSRLRERTLLFRRTRAFGAALAVGAIS